MHPTALARETPSRHSNWSPGSLMRRVLTRARAVHTVNDPVHDPQQFPGPSSSSMAWKQARQASRRQTVGHALQCAAQFLLEKSTRTNPNNFPHPSQNVTKIPEKWPRLANWEPRSDLSERV